jgi:hypothetical protein
MLVECVRAFVDLDCGVMREAGDRFEVSPSRFTAINGTKYGELAVEVSEVPPKASETPSEVSGARPRVKRPRKAASKG